MVQTSPWHDVLHAGTPPPMSYGLFGFATAFLGIAFYLVIEINITVLRRFKKKRGLYFWSLLVSSWGVFFHTLGYVTQWWSPKSPWAMNTAFILFGWSAMVTGQSLVLYSRLHLVIRNYKILQGVLIMIIATAILIEIPQWVTTWASTDTKYSVTKKWSPYDSIMVRVSQLAFLIQEATISCLYIWGTLRVLAPNDKIQLGRVKWDLVLINTYIILVDIIILVLAYTNEHFPKEPIQNFAYAFKLKLEFVVLNQLMSITSLSRSSNFNAGNRYVKSSSSGSAPPLMRSNPSDRSKGMSPPPKQEGGIRSPMSIHTHGRDNSVEHGSSQSKTSEVMYFPTPPYDSNEKLAPTHLRALSDDSQLLNPPAASPWWPGLWSWIPTGEERLQRDQSRVRQGDMRV